MRSSATVRGPRRGARRHPGRAPLPARPGPVTRLGRLLLCLVPLLAAGLLATASPASAHAALTGSDPKAGSVVDRAPRQVSLTFSEDVALSDGALRVLDPDGKEAAGAKVLDLGKDTHGVKLHTGLRDGTYTVTYQVVSADSHPVSGAFTFSIGAPSKTSVVAGGQTVGGGVVGGLYGFGRYVSYAGYIVMVGGGAFLLACWQRGAGVRPLQRLVVGGWLALTAGTLSLLLLRGSYTTSGKVADIFDLSLMGQVLETKSGAALVSRLLLLAAAALCIAVLFGAYVPADGDADEDSASDADADGDVREDADGDVRGKPSAAASGNVPRDAEERRDLAFGLAAGGTVVAVGLAATWAMSEHASTGRQPGIAMPVDIVHLVAVACWLGGLAALLTALYRTPARLPATAVRRFSAIAFGSVVALVATGVYQSWRQVGSWGALTDTDYGQLLLVKVVLVALLVAVAWVSRRWTGRLGEAVGQDSQASDSKSPDSKSPDSLSADSRSPVAQYSDPESQDPESQDTESQDRPSGDPASPDPTRAAQLARQRAALASAKSRRERDADPQRAGLRRSALVEAVIAVALLAVATSLTSTEPARTAEQARTESPAGDAPQQGWPLSVTMPFDTLGKDGRGKVQVDLDPGATGTNEMHVYVKKNGAPADVAELKVALTLKSRNIGPLAFAPEHVVTGHWSAEGVHVPAAGDWEVAVTVRTSDVDQITVRKNMRIG